MCNAFASKVRTRSSAELKRRHAEEYEEIRVRIEIGAYREILKNYCDAHPETGPHA